MLGGYHDAEFYMMARVQRSEKSRATNVFPKLGHLGKLGDSCHSVMQEGKNRPTKWLDYSGSKGGASRGIGWRMWLFLLGSWSKKAESINLDGVTINRWNKASICSLLRISDRLLVSPFLFLMSDDSCEYMIIDGEFDESRGD